MLEDGGEERHLGDIRHRQRDRPRAGVGVEAFASNQFLGAQGNKDFFLNVVSWLAEEEDLLSVRPKDTKQNPIVLTSAQSNLVLWLPLAILPGAVVICGVMVMARRRRTS